MNDESVCRILIVDNELDFAAQTATKLKEIRPALLNHNKLEIELTNNAYFVAETLGQCQAGQPPWDVIIADVYMPFPSPSSETDIAATDLEPSKFTHANECWPCWQYTYRADAALDERIDHGGFRIAQAIAKRLASGEEISGLKLILMSECLFGDERELILDYQSNNSSWLEYYDKADWKRDILEAWPSHQLEPDVFQWALVLAIAQRKWKYWGDSIYRRLPNTEVALVSAITTAQMKSAVTESRRIGADREVETVLITGERGTGREFFGRLIHQVRMASLGIEGEFIDIDCSSIPESEFQRRLFDRAQEAASGTLFIDEVEKLTPHQQGWLYHLLKDKTITGEDGIQTLDFTAHLVICTASQRNLEERNRIGLFHEDLYFLLKDEQLYVKPLRARPADAVALAQALVKRSNSEITLSADARDWIEHYGWPGNIRELTNVIRGAIRKELNCLVTAEDLKRILATNPTLPIPEPDPIPPNKEPTGISEFQADPPFQLHAGTNVLIDSQKRGIPIRWDIHAVLKALLNKDIQKEGALTFAEIAALYRNNSDADRAQAIAHDFARQLRRALDAFGIGHNWLVRTHSRFGYRKGNQWHPKTPLKYKTQAVGMQRNVEQAERDRFAKRKGGNKRNRPEY